MDRPLRFLCIGSGRETTSLPLADAAAKGVRDHHIRDAYSRGRTVRCGLEQADGVGALPGIREVVLVELWLYEGGSVGETRCAWRPGAVARSGPVAAAPTVVAGLLDSAATAAAPR